MSGIANSVRRFMLRVHTFDAQPARHGAVVAAFSLGTGALSLATFYALRTDHCASTMMLQRFYGSCRGCILECWEQMRSVFERQSWFECLALVVNVLPLPNWGL